MGPFYSIIAALACLAFMFQGVAARPCTAVVRFDPMPLQLKASSLSSAGDIFIVKASCDDKANHTQDLAHDGLYYSTQTPEFHENQAHLTVRPAFRGDLQSNP